MNELLEAWRNRRHIAAVDIQENSIRLLEIKKQRVGIKIVRAYERSWTTEGVQPALTQNETFRRLVKECNLSAVQVMLRLPQGIFRNYFLKLPQNYEANVSPWLDEHLAEFLPPGLERSQVVYGYQIFSNTKEQATILLTVARRDIISKWVDVFRNFNLKVVALIGQVQSLLSGLAFLDSRFYEQNLAFLHFESACLVLIITHKGELVQYHEIFSHTKNQSGEDFNLWQAEIQGKLTDYHGENSLHRIILSGDDIPESCKSFFNNLAPVEPGGDLIQDILPNQEGNKFVHLFGIGLQTFYPQVVRQDLLPEDFRNEVEDKKQTVHAMHWAGIAALGLILIWLTLQSVSVFVKRELAVWQKETLKLEKQIKEIEGLKITGTMLSEELALRQDMLNQRTHLARLLFTLSQVTPKNVWLRNLQYGRTEENVESEKAAGVPFVLEGLALDEGGPTHLLAEMEKSRDLQIVQLDLMQSIPPEVVFKKTKKQKVTLVKFRISAWQKENG